jgi:hypothetical protein
VYLVKGSEIKMAVAARFFRLRFQIIEPLLAGSND